MEEIFMEQRAKNISRVALCILALTGVAIMSYLTYIHYANTQSFCDISEKVSCDVVTTSVYSEIFGIPISILGLGYFLFAFIYLIAKRDTLSFQTIFIVTLFVLIPSLYFTLTEILFIKSFCILCETSKGIMLAMLVVSGAAMRPESKLTLRLVAPIVIAGLLAATVTYFAQVGGAPVKEDYSALVQCMNERNVTYYKSVRCNNCVRQEKLLGDAYLRLNSVECHPDGENPNPELCLAKGVDKTPTFIIEESGSEVRRLEGMQSIRSLADFAGCPLE